MNPPTSGRPTGCPARFDASQAIDWVPVSSLISGETRWAPAAYCYYGHGTARADGYRGEPYCVADSNGCAAGNTLEEAILQGLLELIERDACGLTWYTRARRPTIDLDRFDGEPFAPVLEAFAARGRALHVLDLRTDTEVPVALAVAFDRDDGLATRFALGCHLDPRIAVSRALSELAQLEIEGSGPTRRLTPVSRSHHHRSTTSPTCCPQTSRRSRFPTARGRASATSCSGAAGCCPASVTTC